ncbi:hypothetical protein ZIOFF_055732 [Zingiber officinale]|uniref:Phosphofructokinase domain-containing protein n=1 Tax=Zingiber officinale TaxID=94328 RepID=A0A8J5FFG9_ZINOF|nr:hypothetical protein ZIOFF_055732 [Zingiber officinale]
MILLKYELFKLPLPHFVNDDDIVAQKVVVHKNDPKGMHFRRARPRQKVFFELDEVHACIVTCGGLCPGRNTVIREVVCGLYDMYGVCKVLGIEVINKSFGFDTAVEEAQQAINAAHVEAESVENGIGLVKLMGRYSDPTYMIRAVPSNASGNVYCTLLAHSAIHGAMAGYTGFITGPVNGRHAYIPFHIIFGRGCCLPRINPVFLAPLMLPPMQLLDDRKDCCTTPPPPNAAP